MNIKQIAKKDSPKSFLNFHENPETLHINTLENHNYFIPFAENQSSSLFENREASNRFQLLNGEWDFKYYDSIIDMEDDFTSVAPTCKMPVPANWQLDGFDKPQYTNIAYPIPYNPPFVPDDIPAGVYSRSYEYKSDGLRRIIGFEGVDSCLYLFVNGTFVGFSEVTHHTSEFDITAFLKEGSNKITVAVLKWCFGTYMEDQDKIRLSGIFRDVYVLSRPEKCIQSYRVETLFEDEDFTKADFKLAVTGAPAAYKLFDKEGCLLASGKVSDGGESTVNISNPQLWSAEIPNLYKLEITSCGEKIIEEVGFRKVYTEDGVLKLNGQAIKINGSNRHDSYPDTGYAASIEQIKKDLTIMKQHNINAIRTSHYPNAPEFYKLCDRFGFYVIDEGDLEMHGSVDINNTPGWDWSDYSGIASAAGNPLFLKAILDRETLLVSRDINRPCVIIWSLGNESGLGSNLVEAGKLVKSMDQSRLLHYESVHKQDDTSDAIFDLVSRMYPSPHDWHNFLNDKNEKRPFILCEYCHAMGNGPGDLEDYHKVFYSNPRFAGGLIWEFCDHSVSLGKTDDGKEKYGYGGDWGERHNDGNFCCDGLVYPDRRPHTGLMEAKQVYRPIRVYAENNGEEALKNGTFKFENLMSFENAGNMLSVAYEITVNGDLIKTGNIEDFDLAPLSAKEITISSFPTVQLTEALNNNADIFVRFIFTAKNSTLWCQKGENICFNQIKLGPKGEAQILDEASFEPDAVKVPLPDLNKRDANGKQKTVREDMKKMQEWYMNFLTTPVADTSLNYKIIKGDIEYNFNRRTGYFDSIKKAGKEILEQPMKFNFMRAPTDNDSMRGEWFNYHLHDYDTKIYNSSIEEKNETTVVTVNQSFGWNIYQPFMYGKVTYTISMEKGMNVAFDFHASNKVSLLPRLGIRLFVNKVFGKAEYLGYGPTESYIDKHHACWVGKFTQNISDMFEPYIRPQENSSHYDCRFVKIYSPDTTLEFTGENRNISFNASEYSQEELYSKKHNFELEKCKSNVICIDYKMAGVGSNSCGPQLYQKYRIELPEIKGSINMKIN